jgi:hypothetical protein
MGRPPGRPPLGKRAMTTEERQRRYWERVLREQTPPESKEIPTLKRELAQARARIATLEQELARARRAAVPRPESEEIAALQRQLKGVRTQNTNLKAALRIEAELRLKHPIMSRALHRQILGCLHPDRIADPDLKPRYQKTFAAFSVMKFKFIDRE